MADFRRLDELGAHPPALDASALGVDVDVGVGDSGGVLLSGTAAAADQVCGHPKLHTAPDAASRRVARKLLVAGCLAALFMAGEAAGGYMAGSLAVMTDAAHMLSDVCSFGIALTAHHMSRRTPTNTHNFGFHRAEILGALLSIMLIWAVTGVLVYEAVQRVIHPEDVDGRLMFIVACCGLALNLLLGLVLGHPGHSHSHGGAGGGHSHGGAAGAADSTALLGDAVELKPPRSPAGCRSPKAIAALEAGTAAAAAHAHGHAHGGGGAPAAASDEDSINMRAAMLHVIGDVVQSIGVVIAGAVIWARPDWRLADPITTFLFSIVVLFTTWRMLKESVAILMESTPPGVDYADVLKVLAALPPVSDVHDLHIWSITAGKAAMSVHLIASDAETALGLAQEAMWRDFGIFHCTIQVEHETSDECCHPCGV